MLVSAGQADDIRKKHRAWIFALLVKPLHLGELLQVTAAVVAQGSRPPDSRTQGTKGTVVTPQLQSLNPDYRILLVEDSRVNQQVAICMLLKLGYHADLAEDGCEALLMLSEKRYDLVLMDCQMPRMDGYETAFHIRNKPELAVNRMLS